MFVIFGASDCVLGFSGKSTEVRKERGKQDFSEKVHIIINLTRVLYRVHMTVTSLTVTSPMVH